jgi:CRP-like cAMP-binding protein
MASIPTPADLSVVRRINVLRGLKPAVVEELIAPAQVLVLQDGESLFHQGDPATAFFIVTDGWVKIHRITEAGDEAVIYVFAKGDSIAEAVAFTGHAYPASAQAVTDARIVRIPADHVLRCIRSAPDIAIAMLASTSLHLLNLVQQIEQLKAKSGFQRVAAFLASLCSVDQGSCTIALPYDKSLIAGRLGLMPESLSRAFTKLKPLGVEVRASHVVVTDVAKLRRYARGDRGSTRALLAAVSKPNRGRSKTA